MQRPSLLATLALTSGCHVRPESFLPADAAAHAEPRSEHLTGAPRTFVVIGDVRSFVWPTLLEHMLAVHAQREGLYGIENASLPVATVKGWTERPEELRARLSEPGSGPRTALCLVSLGGVGDERGPVKSEHDMVGGEMGAEALERLALELEAAGIERVVFATPLFTSAGGAELALEHVAIERLLAREHRFVEAGPDVFRASRRYYPDAYLAGGEEPNEFGQKLVAEEWYRWLAGPEAREEVVEALYATDYDIEELRARQAEEAKTISP